MPQIEQVKIPGSTNVHESHVIPFPIETVWNTAIRTAKFEWLQGPEGVLGKVEVENGAAGEVGSHRLLHYTKPQATKQRVKVLEISDLTHNLVWEVVESVPGVTVSAAMHGIRLRPITSNNTTLIEWTSNFSNDATQEVLQDSKFKKQEGFGMLLRFLDQKVGKQAVKRDRETTMSEGERSPKRAPSPVKKH